MTKRLLLFANAFPFGTQEPYLMRELPHFSAFDEVYVFALSVRRHQRGHRRALPLNNVTVIPIPFRSPWFYVGRAPLLLWSQALWSELRQMLHERRLSPRRLLRAFGHYSRADHEAKVVARFIRRNIHDRPGDRTVLYAYRFLYQPYLISRLRRLFGHVKTVGRAHGIDLYEERSSSAYLPGRVLNLRSIDELHMVSRHGASYLSGRYPEYAQKIRVSYLGTDDLGVRPSTFAEGQLRIVSCSNVVRVKRLDLLVAALGNVSRELSVEWVHYGEGEEMELLREQVTRLPPNIAVTLRGHVENGEILAAYLAGRHDVIVNVSSSEGLPVSLMEACSTGLPVVATDVGGTNEIVSNDVNGVLLPADPSPAQVARAIERFARMTRAEYEKFSRASREVWEAAFDSSRNYSQFVSHLLELDAS